MPISTELNGPTLPTTMSSQESLSMCPSATQNGRVSGGVASVVTGSNDPSGLVINSATRPENLQANGDVRVAVPVQVTDGERGWSGAHHVGLWRAEPAAVAASSEEGRGCRAQLAAAVVRAGA